MLALTAPYGQGLGKKMGIKNIHAVNQFSRTLAAAMAGLILSITSFAAPSDIIPSEGLNQFINTAVYKQGDIQMLKLEECKVMNSKEALCKPLATLPWKVLLEYRECSIRKLDRLKSLAKNVGTASTISALVTGRVVLGLLTGLVTEMAVKNIGEWTEEVSDSFNLPMLAKDIDFRVEWSYEELVKILGENVEKMQKGNCVKDTSQFSYLIALNSSTLTDRTVSLTLQQQEGIANAKNYLTFESLLE